MVPALYRDFCQKGEFSKNTNYTYSFATKYCNWHKKDLYPIFDSVVKRVLSRLNRAHHFSDVRVKDYKDYTAWKQSIHDMTAFSAIEDYRYKTADEYLWALGVNDEV